MHSYRHDEVQIRTYFVKDAHTYGVYRNFCLEKFELTYEILYLYLPVFAKHSKLSDLSSKWNNLS